jgi:hypothetical protein
VQDLDVTDLAHEDDGLTILLDAIEQAGPDPVPATPGEWVSGQVTFLTRAGRRIAAIVPAHVGEEHLEDELGVLDPS